MSYSSDEAEISRPRPQSQGTKAFKYNGHSQGRIEEFNKGEAVTAMDEIFFHLQITVCEFYFIFGELKWIFF